MESSKMARTNPGFVGSGDIPDGFHSDHRQFYTARLLLGAAEASFVPAMLVYLTRWFSLHDRSRAIACLFAALRP